MSIKNQKNSSNEFKVQLKIKLEQLAFRPDFEILHLCQVLGISRSSLHRKIKALYKQSTAIYIRNFRLQKAKTLLLTTSLSISQIATQVGFTDFAYFSKCFKSAYGVSARTIRKEKGFIFRKLDNDSK